MLHGNLDWLGKYQEEETRLSGDGVIREIVKFRIWLSYVDEEDKEYADGNILWLFVCFTDLTSVFCLLLCVLLLAFVENMNVKLEVPEAVEENSSHKDLDKIVMQTEDYE